jgi:glycosyltransferase involved in cell wall biosynthesis
VQLSVSVVIPNYNYARFVGQAIESALSQSVKPLEVIVVDNGSTDHSLEVLRAFGDRIRLIAQQNRGQSGARNAGIEAARGELVAFLDADDVWLPRKLERQLPLFDRAEVGLVYGGYVLADAELKDRETRIPKLRGRLLKQFASGPGAVITGGESTAVVRKACFERIGLFDPELSISAGWDIYRRISGLYEIELVPEPLMKYRQHGSNASGRVDIYEHDTEIKLRKMFEDPNAREIWPMKRSCYGRAYLAVSGSYLHAGNVPDSLRLLARAARVWPEGMGYALKAPLRYLSRRREARVG